MKKINSFWIHVLMFAGVLIILTYSCKKDEDSIPDPPTPVPVLSDLDGNEYHSIVIGTQTWMVENLKTSKLSDTSAIPFVANNLSWSNHVSPAACWYDNNGAFNNPYGVMYNWYAVNTAKLCPDGWHVPSEDEWFTLLNYLGGDNLAGAELKETGTDHWIDPNSGANNETGFTGLPGGRRYLSGAFKYFGSYGYWWSSTDTAASHARGFRLAYNSTEALNDIFHKQAALSVRCLKD